MGSVGSLVWLGVAVFMALQLYAYAAVHLQLPHAVDGSLACSKPPNSCVKAVVCAFWWYGAHVLST